MATTAGTALYSQQSLLESLPHLDSPTHAKSITTFYIRQMMFQWRPCRFRIALFLPTLCMWFLERQTGLMNVTTVSNDPIPVPPTPSTMATAIHHSVQGNGNGYPGQATTISNNHQTKVSSQKIYQGTTIRHNQKVTPLVIETNNIDRTPSEQLEWEHRRNSMDYLKQVFPGPPILPLNTTSSCQGERVLDGIQIHVLTWKRSTELASLLKTLEEADYGGYHQPDLPLYIHVDGGALRDVKKQARKFTWKHGTKHVDIRSTNVGLREMWLSSLRGSAKKGNNTLMLVLEDDMVLSPLYFQWLLQMVDHYARNPDCRDSNLVGFSLSPIVYQNMYKPFSNWSADEELGRHLRLTSQGRHSAYLSSVPSSWGGVFWSDLWNQFDSFVQERVKPPLYNISAEEDPKSKPYTITPEVLQLPHQCTTKKWTKSWKRFLVDFMYGRGMWMLYPDLRNDLGLAYARQTTGTHVNKFNRDRYKVGLVEDVSILKEMQSELPSYEQLLVVDLEHSLSSKELVTAHGTLFLNRIAKECKPCQNLVRKWARPDWNVPSNGYDHFPLLCAADLYTSVATNAFRPTSTTTGGEDSDRYLVITSPAVNRQDAKVWAALLNRRLILTVGANTTSPPKSDATESNLLKTWLAQYASLPLVTYPNSKNMSPLLIDDLNQTNITSPWRILLLTSPSNTTTNSIVPRIDLRHLFSTPTSLATMQHLLGGCSDRVLVLNGVPTLDFVSSSNLTISLIHEKVAGVKQPKKDKVVKGKPGRVDVKGLKGKLRLSERQWSDLAGAGKKVTTKQ